MGIAYDYSPKDLVPCVVRSFVVSVREKFCRELLGRFSGELPRSLSTPLLTTMPVCNHKQSLRDIPGTQGVMGIACVLTASARWVAVPFVPNCARIAPFLSTSAKFAENLRVSNCTFPIVKQVTGP